MPQDQRIALVLRFYEDLPVDEIAPASLIEALQAERAVAGARLHGIEEAMVLPAADTAQARRTTDVALGTFDTFTAAAPNGDAYSSARAALDELGRLRADIDADAGPRDLSRLPESQQVGARYATMIDALIADQLTFAATIDEPVVRDGATAYGRGLRLSEATARLADASLVAIVVPGPASYVEVGRLDGRVRNDLDALVSECAGTRYEAACAAAVDDVERSGMLDAVEVLFDGGSPDLTALLGPQHAGTWATFIEQVGATMSAGA